MQKAAIWIAMWMSVLGGFGAWGEKGRNVELYNLQQPGLVSMHYDPVSYYPEGGSQPGMGSVAHSLEFEGVPYRFQSEKNVSTFMTQPAKYEPTYGGWCAWGMTNDARIPVSPEFFTLHKGRLHLFVNARAKSRFDANLQVNEGLADKHWKAFSGEEPRVFE